MNFMEADRKKHRSLFALAWRRLRRNKLAMFGLIMILIAFLISVLGALVRPDSTRYGDSILELRRKPPGFTMTMLQVEKNRPVEQKAFWEQMFFGGQPLSYDRVPIMDHSFEGGDLVVEKFSGNKEVEGKKIPFNIADILYPLDVSRPYRKVDDGEIEFYTLDGKKRKVPIEEMRERIEEERIVKESFPLGTDGQGRDLLSRLMAGTIVSLSVGVISVVISVFIGVTLGAISGFFKGWVDDVIMWLINVIWSIPSLLLVIAITLTLGRGFASIFVAVGLIMWVEVARIVRGQVLGVREKEFVEAGRALGFNSSRLIARHIIPNVMGPVIVMAAANFAAAILIEAGLSFLGIGAQPPMPSWGSMIKKNYGEITMGGGDEYLAILPGVCIMLLVLAFMLVGNGLRDAFDTKTLDEEVRTGA